MPASDPSHLVHVRLFAHHGRPNSFGITAREYDHLLRMTACHVEPRPYFAPRDAFSDAASERPIRVNVTQVRDAELIKDGGLDKIINPHQRNVAIYYADAELLPDDDVRRDALAKFDMIWAPSPFSQKVVDRLFEGPIHLVQPTLQMGAGGIVTAERSPSPPFTFLYIFDLKSFWRKNPLALIDAFRTAFADNPDFALVLKWKSTGRQRHLEEKLAAATGHVSNITLLSEDLSRDDLEALYRSADCYVSPHMCEGLGMTLVEAIRYGLPVIATDFGATTQIITKKTAFPVGGHERRDRLGTVMEVDVSALADTMRYVTQNDAEAQRRTAKAFALVSEIYDPDRLRRELQKSFQWMEQAWRASGQLTPNNRK